MIFAMTFNSDQIPKKVQILQNVTNFLNKISQKSLVIVTIEIKKIYI